MGNYSTLLFATPSYLSGAARTLDLGGTFDDYNDMPTGEMADAAAMQSDWYAIGEDLRHAIQQYEQEGENDDTGSHPA